MTILAVGDAVWTGLIAGVVTVVLAALTQWNAAKVAAKVEKVKDALETKGAETDTKLNRIETTGDKNHNLLNAAMGYQMELVAKLLEKEAARTHDAADIAMAHTARLAYENHMKNQKPVGPMPVTIVAAAPVPVTVVEPASGSETVDASQNQPTGL